MSKCLTKYCKNKTRNRKLCHKCAKRQYKERHPERYCYSTLKNNAKRRKIEFKLTFEEFLEFAVRTTYLVGRGRKKDSLTIDRIDSNKGYEVGNIQVLTNCNNVRKMLEARYDVFGIPESFTVRKLEDFTPTEEIPF